MIILITGATHSGKTYLAQKLLEKYKYPYLSLDHLKMGLIRSKKTNLTTNDDREMTDYLWPIVKEMIKTAIENNQNLIIEGCYIPFDYKDSFDMEYNKHIRYICLALSKEYIDKYYDIIKEKANVIENRIDDEWFNKEILYRDNKFYIDGAIKHNLNIEIIENDYNKSIGKIANNI